MLQNKLLQLPITKREPAYLLVIGSGGEIKEMLYPFEYISVLIRVKDGSNVTSDEIFRDFSKYGQISEVINFNSNFGWWGKVIFVNSNYALKAVKRNLGGSNYKVKPSLQYQQKTHVGTDFEMDAKWTRRPGRGFGFISCGDHSKHLISHGSFKIGNEIYEFTRDKKTSSDIKVKGFNQNYSESQLKAAIEAHFPGIKISKCTIPKTEKDIEAPEILYAMQRDFIAKLKQLTNNPTDGAFVVTMSCAMPKDFDYQADVTFRNVADGLLMMNTKFYIGPALVRLSPKLQHCITVDKDLYAILQGEFCKDYKKVRISVKEKTSGNNVVYEIAVTGRDEESVIRVRMLFNEFVQGKTLCCSDMEFRSFQNPPGRKFIANLRKVNNCLITMDRRRKYITIRGLRDNVGAVEEEIEKKKAPLKDKEELVISLKQKKGFMKLLLGRYGDNFEVLYEQAKVYSVYFDFVAHTLYIIGNPVSLQMCTDMIDALSAEQGVTTNETNVNRKCPICLHDVKYRGYILQTCSHIYCTECIRTMCQKAMDHNDLPILCVANGCSEPISVTDISSFVENEIWVRSSLNHFIGQKMNKYRHCLTPNCIMIYRVSTMPNANPFICPICHIRICAFCKIEYRAHHCR